MYTGPSSITSHHLYGNGRCLSVQRVGIRHCPLEASIMKSDKHELEEKSSAGLSKNSRARKDREAGESSRLSLVRAATTLRTRSNVGRAAREAEKTASFCVRKTSSSHLSMDLMAIWKVLC